MLLMREKFLWVMLAASVIMSTGMKKKRYEPKPEPTTIAASPSPKASHSPLPIPTGRGYLTIDPVVYYSTPAERIKIKAAGDKVNSVIQSACFADFIKARKLIQTDGRTPAQVVAHIQALRDTVPVNMYYRRMGGIGGTSAVAYREPPEKDINLNRAYFTLNLSTCEFASTIAHESMHAIGEYDHDFNWSRSRDFSVPYSVNAAFEECCE
jgi:hypothetical protein